MKQATMAKTIVTQSLVDEAADALIAAGEEPTIVSVQARIGAGSYTTVKRHLDKWREQRTRVSVVEAPPEITERGATFVRDLWTAAVALAEKQLAVTRETASREVELARKGQADAEAALERVEQEVEGLREQLAGREQAFAAQAEELAQSRAALGAEQARSVELQRQTQELRADLERHQAGGRAEYDRLATEMAALKEQVAKAFAGREQA